MPNKFFTGFREQTGKPRFFLYCTLAIAALAIVLRAAAALSHPYVLPDSVEYQALASNILAGKPYMVTGMLAKRIPGYPIFLAGIYFLFGNHQLAPLLVQALCGGATVVVVCYLGRKISPVVGLTAGLLTALDPLSIGFSAALLSEVPFALVLAAGALLAVKIIEKPASPGLWAALGVLWTLGTYLRAEAVLCIFSLTAWIVLTASKLAGDFKRLVGPILAILVVFAGLMPWWVRNYQLFHEDFFRLTTLEGISLYEAVYPDATGGPKQSDITLPTYMLGMNESQRDLAFKQMAIQQIRDNPARIMKLAIIKMARTWSPWLNSEEYSSPRLNAVLTIWYSCLYALALAGIVGFLAKIGRYKQSKTGALTTGLFGVLVINILYFTLMHALFIGSVRYRVPLMPEVTVLAAMGFGYLTRTINARQTEGQPNPTVPIGKV
ncbi:MAG TPA: glycosyltransferase family 39 protein [Phycisphaerae bacterium]|nr:glycosyltransferase family 39 protein [Phycisphaerae bacterium]